jgi:hypothetical protein
MSRRFDRRFRRRLEPGVVVTGYSDLPRNRGEEMAFLLTHARSLGCTCNPDITTAGPLRRGEATPVAFAHDDWCPLAPDTRGGA